MAKRGAKKKATKRKAVKRTAARKTVKRTAPGRKPAARKKPARKSSGPSKPVTKAQMRTVNVGCFGGECTADKDPFHMDPGETFQICAPNNDVIIHFTRRSSPLIPSGDLHIAKGTCVTVQVDPNTPKDGQPYDFHCTCTHPPCGHLAADPEMICP